MIVTSQPRSTGKERDTETGLDNFGKRYYSSSVGRFMTPDPIAMMKQRVLDPQQLNMYAYARNSPVTWIDPLGMFAWKTTCDEKHDASCHADRQKFRDGLDKLKASAKSFKKGSLERNRLERALALIGKENKGGPAVAFSNLGTDAGQASADGKTLTFDTSKPTVQNASLAAGVIAEEATHAADRQDSRSLTTPLSPFSFEYRGHQSNAWAVQGALGDTSGLILTSPNTGNSVTIWDPTTGHRATDAEITQQVLDDYNVPVLGILKGQYSETLPHNPWSD